MIPFQYITPVDNPHYNYYQAISAINYNFGLISGNTTIEPYLNLSGGTVTGQTTFSGNSINPILIIRNPDTFPSGQDNFQVWDGSGAKQLFIDSSNQFGFNAGLNGPLYFGTFANPSAGLGGFSKPNEVINCFSVNTVRMGVGGGGSYFAITGPQALLELRGKENEKQFIIQANGTQTENIFEGRNSSEAPIVVIDSNWSLRGPSISATTLSAGTYYSGVTPLELIINSLITATTSTITGSQVQPGINTFTAGTNTAPSVNVTGLSINNIFVSGLTYLPQIYTDEIVPYNAGDIVIGSAYYGVTLLGPITMDNVIAADVIFNNLIVTNNSILNNVTASTTLISGTSFASGTNALKVVNSTGGTTFLVNDSGYISTSAPGYTLDIKANGSSTLSEFNTTNIGYQITSTQGYLRVNRTTVGPFTLYPNNNVSRVDLTSDAGGSSPLISMTTVANGFNVGINNTTPIEKLDISGNAFINGGLTANTISNGRQSLNGAKTHLTGTTILSGVNVSTFADTGTTRMVESNSGGTLSATRQLVSAFGLPVSAMTVLSLSTNWDNNGLYTGTTIDSTYQGQEYYDDAYYYRAVADNYFIRLIRG